MISKFIYILLFTSTMILAQDFSEIRIYINPGHGGHDSNDRYISETGFWESDGNLSKGLYLKEILDSHNAITKISRITNTSADDLGLSVIVADANNFGADYFHSIHSNGFNGQANYTLILFQGKDNAPTYPDAKVMGGYLADEIYKAHRTTAKYNRGDADFYGTGQPYLGVLKGLTMPGTLSEGSFHDYIPESWRLKNDSYLKHEAWAIAKAFIRYFGLDSFGSGEIAGILRDPFDYVDYYYISSTLDGRKPLNLVKAILMPDSIVYEGDSYNNGFYMFDEIPPGDYDLILEAENYERDTIHSVTVSANKTTFADKNLNPKPDYSVPVITSFIPNETENVRLNSDIILEFSVKMDRVSVEQSFSISPNVIGAFSWESNDRRMIFSPNDFLEPGSNYQISLNLFAKSAFDVFIDQQFSHSFLTRSSLNLVSTYPEQNAENISTTVKIIIKFDAPINNNTLGGNVYLQDLNENNINPYIDQTDYQNGRIIFEPYTILSNSTNYQIKLLNGITDVEGSNFNTDTTIQFRTEASELKEGSILSDFEDLENWWQPEQSGSTSGIDGDNTSFQISTKKSIDGTHAGRLIYQFSEDSLGMCRIYNHLEPAISSNQNSQFGMWVFGDLSYNILEYWFRDPQGTNIRILLGELNWTGWKFKEVDLSSYGSLKFHSIVVTQGKTGAKSGQLYFDSILSDIITDIDNVQNNMPDNYILSQNYPNPFNPTTSIEYSIPNLSGGDLKSVQLKIYDVLGREILTLVNQKQSPGKYQITFDASEFASGIYFYQMRIDNTILTKKMILSK